MTRDSGILEKVYFCFNCSVTVLLFSKAEVDKAFE